jgi:hypothetical protein
MYNNFHRFITPIKNPPNNDEITVIILGANVTPRRKGFGAKSLFPIGQQWNIIETQIDSIKNAYPKADIILVTGFQSQQVINKKYPIRIVENVNFEETSEAEQLRIALNATIGNKVFIVGGDLVFDSVSIKSVASHGSNVLFSNKPKEDVCLGIVHHNNILENVIYDMPNEWLNCAFFEGKELDALRKFLKNREHTKLLLFEVINYLVSNGCLIRTVEQKDGYMYKAGI